MNRRDLLRNCALAGCGLAIPSALNAAEHCGYPNENGFALCETGIPSLSLIPAQRLQDRSQWCWAACIAMIARYYDFNLSQETIVQEAYGRLVNLPAISGTIVQALSRNWEDDDGISLNSQCDVIWDPSVGNVRTDAPQLATQYLSRNIPLIVGTLGHAMVLTNIGFFRHVQNPYLGMVSYAHVRDPWPAAPRLRTLSAVEWSSIKFLVAVRMS